MEDTRSKRTADTNREKYNKKKNSQEKKTKSETTTFSTGSSVTDPSLENIIVVGKSCNYGKSKLHESGYRLHECYSEAAINLVPDSSKTIMDIVRVEGLHPAASNSSFMSARSDCSDVLQKRIHDLEDALHNQHLVIHFLKKQLGEKELVTYTTVSTETDMGWGDIEDFKIKLKELEKKVSNKEKKIKDLNQRIEDSFKARDTQSRENKCLSHQVNLLNRQLKSMFELLGTNKWNGVDAAEVEKYKIKAAELETLVTSKEEKKNELARKIETLTEYCEVKEKEVQEKSRELIEFKNRSTLEMCKLISQIDGLQKEAKKQSQLLESKILEARSSMDEEVVKITQKLEDQYQKDMKSAIQKIHGDFERLSELPKTAIEKLLRFCDPENIDFITFQKEWDKQRSMLEAKILSMQEDHNKEVVHLKDSYDGKVMFLKTQVEALTTQLKERKEIIDIFESELMEYKSNSSMNLLKASSLGDDISSLKELYTAELCSQKQVHKLQVDILEEKVKTLTEEILYHAKNEEIYLQELENAKKMALALREKYELFVFEWEDKVERDYKGNNSVEVETTELDNMISEFKALIESLKKSEEIHEEKIKMLETQNDDERITLLRDIENLKVKLMELQEFQKTQAKLDETIHNLIKAVNVNYTKTVEALLMSHVTELSHKQTEIWASEKRHIKEIDALKNDHEKDLEELRDKVKVLEESKLLIEKETGESKTLKLFKKKAEEQEAKLEMYKKKAEELEMFRKEIEEQEAFRKESEVTDFKKITEELEMCRKKVEELETYKKKAEELETLRKIAEKQGFREEAEKKEGEKVEDPEKVIELEMLRKKVGELETYKKNVEEQKAFREKTEQEEAFRKEAELEAYKKKTEVEESRKVIEELEILRKKVEELETYKKKVEELETYKKKVEELETYKKNVEEQKAFREKAEQEDAFRKEAELEAYKKKAEELKALEKKIEELSTECMKLEGKVAMKEETEKALNESIRELEEVIMLKEKDCKKELEELTAKCLKIQILSAAKDDFLSELENKLNESEKLLEKSCMEVDRLGDACSQLEKTTGQEMPHLNDVGDFIGCKDRFERVRSNGERLKMELIKVVERVEFLEGMNKVNGSIPESFLEAEEFKKNLTLATEKNAALEEEKRKILDENDKMKEEISNLVEEVKRKENFLAELNVQEEQSKLSELKEKLAGLNAEKKKILLREELAEEEKRTLSERNKCLEDTIKDLNERIVLLMELAGNKGTEEMFSISLQEVRVLYEEEREMEVEKPVTASAVACQATLGGYETHKGLWLSNEELRKENETLRNELQEREGKSKEVFHEEMVSKVKNIQKELSQIINERDGLVAVLDSLQAEKETLEKEVENLKVENHAMKVIAEKTASLDDPGLTEMDEKVENLREYIKALTKKLDLMKASNEILMSESHEHLKHKQNLVSELQEAWSERYEIEDQLAKVRRQNAILNMHRQQLEETNKRISNLVADGKPSVVSWIKIHETVESIVDEVLAMKPTFSDSGSVSGMSQTPDVARTTPDLKLMTEVLHSHLKNKTMLCNELTIQKETLEKELKNLEVLLRESGSKFADRKVAEESSSVKKEHLDMQGGQLENCSLVKRQALHWETEEDSPLSTLNRLKRNLADQVELEKAQFRESLELEIRELAKEMPKATKEESQCGERDVEVRDDEAYLKAIEVEYEEEVVKLTREFEAEVEKLKEAYDPEKEGENFQKNYAKAIDTLKSYFERKWTDLEERFTETYLAQKQKRLKSISILEPNLILEEFNAILSAESEEEEEKKKKIESFLKRIINRRDGELRSLREKYEEAVTLLEQRHSSEVQKLQSVVFQLKENILMALKRGEVSDLDKQQHEDLIESIRAEYDAKLEEEKKRLCDSLEEVKQKHQREVLALEEFWTEKLSECETRCAMIKATRQAKGKSQGECDESLKEEEKETEESKNGQGIDQLHSERSEAEESQTDKYSENCQGFGANNYTSGFQIKELEREESICVSCLSRLSIFDKMEVETDDDKLDVMLQRDTLQEMISSVRNIVTRLLTYIGHDRAEPCNASFDNVDDTMYKSIHLDLSRTLTDVSMTSNNALLAMDLSSLFQEIKDNSLLNSSEQVRFELERCLRQLKNDATCLLAMSCPENPGLNLSELIKKFERDKKELEAKVIKIEEVQKEMKTEMNTTKDRLSQWERHLEVVSEGYGEEIVEPKQIISLSDLKDKLKLFLTEHCAQSPQDINFLDEICHKGDCLQEEWKREKHDLQRQERCANAKRGGQIDVADKQVHSLKNFLEEQAVEREQEREAFDREISQLRENLKAKERDHSVQNRTNREVGHPSVMSLADRSVEALEGQMKDLTARLKEMEKNKDAVEGEFQNAVKKIWSLREVIQELEAQLAEVSERESNLKTRVEKLETLLREESKDNKNLKEELEASRNQIELKYSEHVKTLEDELINLRQVAEQVNPENLTQLKANLRQIEAILIKKTKDLEQLHVSSANVSCSSPSEDVSIRDHLDATRCSTPDEMRATLQPLNIALPIDELDRVHEKLARHTRAEEVAMKCIQDLRMQLRSHRKAFEEVQTERDILLEKVDLYLKENSSLKVRLEEQRCNAGLLQKQLNANLESQIIRLEVDVEKLNELCNEKDKQLRDLKEILENTTKSLKVRETEALNKSKEENALITTLKTDLANALNENGKLEAKLEKTMENLRQTFKMPALIDSMLDEKNAEIDRLEKEVARLSSEKTPSNRIPSSCSVEGNHKRKIRFSEPESFSGNISSISMNCQSDLRNFSENFADFKNSSFKIKRPVGYSTKLESISSIAPLQLSPRGVDTSFSWKSNFPSDTSIKSPQKLSSTKRDLQQMEEISKLQGEIESKQRKISELHLEIDILKRQMVEANQEADLAKSRTKEMQNELMTKEEEIRTLNNKEKSLLMTLESLKANHAEETEELQKKLCFEHGKVEKVYEEIKALEVKKVEIEEAFLSLKEDYNEKLNGERRVAEGLLARIRALELKNGESSSKMAAMETEMKMSSKESEKTIEALVREMAKLKSENERIHSISSEKANAETQVEREDCLCLEKLTLEKPKNDGAAVLFNENLEELKVEFDKMAATMEERDFNKKEAFSYAIAVKKLLSVILTKIDELTKELEFHMKKVMECSVDDLALKVQKELVLSAKLDNELLSSIEKNGFASKEVTPQRNLASHLYGEAGDGDRQFVVPKPLENAAMTKVVGLCEEMRKKMAELEKEKNKLGKEITEQQKVIRLLEESLRQERDRLLEEKDRCCEDAKIMELLRVNLERGLQDVRAKDTELKKEKQQKMMLEKEVESYRKLGLKGYENKKVTDLNAQLESQKEKLVSIGKLLEEERKKNQELKLSLEEARIERMTDKSSQRLLESDLALLREQKQNLKLELIKTRKLLQARDKEIRLLKQKVNLQEIDIKALSIPGIRQQNLSDVSTASNWETFDLCSSSENPSLMRFKVRKLNSCVQQPTKEGFGIVDAIPFESQETEQMRDIIKKLEESSDTKLAEETLIPDLDVERKLWALEKGRLVMDIEALRQENEGLKHDLIETCKGNDCLKLENANLKKEARSPKEGSSYRLDHVLHQERISHLTRKYMRAESYRKALAWQKNYLTITLKEYQRSEEAWRKSGRKKKELKRREEKFGKFKTVALAVVAIFRMKFIVKRWRRNAISLVFSLLDPQIFNKVPSPASALDMYNEPINPLSYQTQNIFRQSSSQILRTPPSRDPGPQTFPISSKNIPNSLETYEYLQENIGLMKALP